MRRGAFCGGRRRFSRLGRGIVRSRLGDGQFRGVAGPGIGDHRSGVADRGADLGITDKLRISRGTQNHAVGQGLRLQRESRRSAAQARQKLQFIFSISYVVRFLSWWFQVITEKSRRAKNGVHADGKIPHLKKGILSLFYFIRAIPVFLIIFSRKISRFYKFF